MTTTMYGRIGSCAAAPRLFGVVLFDLRVVVVDVARAALGKLAIALVHFARDPVQHAGHFFQIDHDRREQMRHAVVRRQLHALGIDHQEAQFVGREVRHQARDDGVDAHALARAGGARDQQVRHRRQIGRNGLPGHILPQRDGQRAFVLHLLEGFAFDHIAQGHRGDFVVGHFNAHDVLARHRRFDADGLGGQRQRQIVGQRRDLADLHFGDLAAALHKARLHAELRDGRPAIHFDHFAFHAKRLQRVFDDVRILAQIVFAQRAIFAAFKNIFDRRAFPRLLQADDVREQRAGG